MSRPASILACCPLAPRYRGGGLYLKSPESGVNRFGLNSMTSRLVRAPPERGPCLAAPWKPPHKFAEEIEKQERHETPHFPRWSCRDAGGACRSRAIHLAKRATDPRDRALPGRGRE